MHWTRWLSGGGVVLTAVLLWAFLRHRCDVRETKRMVEEIHQREIALASPLTVQALREEHEATRSHISGVVDSIRGDTKVAKSNSHAVVRIMRRFAKQMGISSDDIPGPS